MEDDGWLEPHVVYFDVPGLGVCGTAHVRVGDAETEWTVTVFPDSCVAPWVIAGNEETRASEFLAQFFCAIGHPEVIAIAAD